MASKKKSAGAAKPLNMPTVGGPERGPMVWLVASFLSIFVRLMFRVKFVGGRENIPKKGGYVLVQNHVTNLDGLGMAYFIFWRLRRLPHFLAKESLFRVPVLGWCLLQLGQIPVFRGTNVRNDEPMRVAIDHLKAGQVICIYPEGTLTRDPNQWPMRGKSGALRLALAAGVPIIPAGQWGTEEILGTYSSKFRPGFWKPMRILVGKEFKVDELRGREATTVELAEATSRLMDEITKLVEVLRNEVAPEQRHDPASHGQSVTGNFNKKKGE